MVVGSLKTSVSFRCSANGRQFLICQQIKLLVSRPVCISLQCQGLLLTL